MIFHQSIGHYAQVDLVVMSSCKTDDGFKWIVWYMDHHSGKCDFRATQDKTAAEITPVVIRIMTLTLIPNIIQSDIGGEFLGETINAIKVICQVSDDMFILNYVIENSFFIELGTFLGVTSLRDVPDIPNHKAV
jgi:hypothetical protein